MFEEAIKIFFSSFFFPEKDDDSLFEWEAVYMHAYSQQGKTVIEERCKKLWVNSQTTSLYIVYFQSLSRVKCSFYKFLVPLNA